MTLPEAIRSGKSFRHKRTGFQYGPMLPAWDSVRWSHEDVLLDVWEIEEKKIEITKSSLSKAWFRILDKNNDKRISLVEVLQELGLDLPA